MKFIIIMLLACFTTLYAHKSMTKAELKALKTAPELRSKAVDAIVDSIYKETIRSAIKGIPGYRWSNPGMEFDKSMGDDIKYNLQVLFPDSYVEYIERRNEFEIYWN